MILPTLSSLNQILLSLEFLIRIINNERQTIYLPTEKKYKITNTDKLQRYKKNLKYSIRKCFWLCHTEYTHLSRLQQACSFKNDKDIMIFAGDVSTKCNNSLQTYTFKVSNVSQAYPNTHHTHT
uniref:Uncharacterized protein n=1 Tax=Cacopsylla melanoneura TaxID=428564 RepID=A0A8D8M438_9HEMI